MRIEEIVNTCSFSELSYTQNQAGKKKEDLIHDKNYTKRIQNVHQMYMKKKKGRFCCPLVHIYKISVCLAYFIYFADLIILPT